MISFYTLQMFAHFFPQDSTTSMIGRLRHSLSEALTLYSGQTVTPTFPYIFQSTTKRGHTTYSTMPEPIMACGCTRKFLGMKNCTIPLSLGGIPQGNHTGTLGSPWARTGFSRCPGKPLGSPGCPNHSTHMCVNVATLKLPLIIISLSYFMNHTYQSPSTSMAKLYIVITNIPGVFQGSQVPTS